jgi:hypothetical protein
MDPEAPLDTEYEDVAVARDALIGDFLANRLTAAQLVEELARLTPAEPDRGLDLSVDLVSDRSVDLSRPAGAPQQRTRARHGA